MKWTINSFKINQSKYDTIILTNLEGHFGLVGCLASFWKVVVTSIHLNKMGFTKHLYFDTEKRFSAIKNFAGVVTLVSLLFPTLFGKWSIFTCSPWLWVFCPLSFFHYHVVYLYRRLGTLVLYCRSFILEGSNKIL